MRHLRIVAPVIATLLLAGVFGQPARADVSFEMAYSNLSHSGSWLVSAQYGRVWQPREYNRQWNPYYDGHWVFTDFGWTWVSDYEWGSIPYHYGTWVADPYAGWVWIPGRVWAPSWVVFRTDSDYIGWAPVPPGYSVGMSIDFGGPSSFVFVSSRDFMAPRVRTSVITGDRVNVLIRNTTVVNNIVVENNVVINRGPDYRSVEKATGRPIRAERIESVSRVAPFANVSRTQLAVDPEASKHGIRVAEQVPASRPLPSHESGGGGEQNNSSAEASRPNKNHQGNHSSAQQPVTRSAPTPSPAELQRQAQRAPAPSPEPATGTSSQAKAKQDPPQHAKGQQKDKPRQEPQQAKAPSTTNPQHKEPQQAKAPSTTKPQQKEPQQAKAPSTAKGKKDAQQHAQGQPKGKPEADTKAKKDTPVTPEKDGQGTDKGGKTEQKDGTNQ